jgi:hypothetical protein
LTEWKALCNDGQPFLGKYKAGKAEKIRKESNFNKLGANQEQTCTRMDLGSPSFVVDGILVQGQLLQILSQAA